MKKLLYVLISVTIGIGFLGCATTGTETGGTQQQAFSVSTPIVVVASPMVKLDPKGTVSFVGCGFTPGQEINLLFTDANGAEADIGYALKPEPKANESGAWYTTWTLGSHVSRKVIKEGVYIITVTDSDFNSLAQAAVAFYEAEGKK